MKLDPDKHGILRHTAGKRTNKTIGRNRNAVAFITLLLGSRGGRRLKVSGLRYESFFSLYFSGGRFQMFLASNRLKRKLVQIRPAGHFRVRDPHKNEVKKEAEFVHLLQVDIPRRERIVPSTRISTEKRKKKRPRKDANQAPGRTPAESANQAEVIHCALACDSEPQGCQPCRPCLPCPTGRRRTANINTSSRKRFRRISCTSLETHTHSRDAGVHARETVGRTLCASQCRSTVSGAYWAWSASYLLCRSG